MKQTLAILAATAMLMIGCDWAGSKSEGCTSCACAAGCCDSGVCNTADCDCSCKD